MSLPKPSFNSHDMMVVHSKTTQNCGQLALEFTVCVNGEVHTDVSNPLEYKYINDVMSGILNDNFKNYLLDYDSLEKACEIYYGMIA